MNYDQHVYTTSKTFGTAQSSPLAHLGISGGHNLPSGKSFRISSVGIPFPMVLC